MLGEKEVWVLVSKDNGLDADEISGAWLTITGGDCACHPINKECLEPLSGMHS